MFSRFGCFWIQLKQKQKVVVFWQSCGPALEPWTRVLFCTTQTKTTFIFFTSPLTVHSRMLCSRSFSCTYFIGKMNSFLRSSVRSFLGSFILFRIAVKSIFLTVRKDCVIKKDCSLFCAVIIHCFMHDSMISLFIYIVIPIWYNFHEKILLFNVDNQQDSLHFF